jgi:hypothetical protein
MAKPRVFISSTYYDLKFIRRSVEQFIESLGYEATVFESGDVPFSHDAPLDESCYREIGLCHILVLIIGGRYGSSASEARERAGAGKGDAASRSERNRVVPDQEKDKRFAFYNSVTSKEYQTARELDIPIYIFVEKGVLAEYETYKKNRNAELQWAHVDSVNIFRLLDDIFAQSRNNLVREFGTADDITAWLRDQWAGLLAHFIARKRDDVSVGQLKSQMDSLASVVSALKTYSEQIVRNVAKSDSEQIISNVDKELHAQQREAMLKSVKGLRHLIEDHKANPKEIFKVFSEAETYKALLDGLNRTTHEPICVLAVDMLLHSPDEINRARVNLGLDPFPSIEPGDLDHFRSYQFRDAQREEGKKTKAAVDNRDDPKKLASK